MGQSWQYLKEASNNFQEHRDLRLAAATAYYAVFSIGPLLVLAVGLAGLIFGEQTVQKEVGQQLRGFVGESSAKLVESMMGAQQKGGSLLATVVGGVALVLGATGVFGQLQDSLNTIWGVAAKPGQSIRVFIRDRFFSMAMVLGIGFLLLVSMVLSTVVTAFAHYIGNLIALPSWVVPVINNVISLLVIWLLFGLMFKVLPDVKLRWADVWVGAAGTALLFTAGKYLLGLYLAYQTSASAYGAGSAFVVILLYVYYSSLILYFGAEFTEVYARKHGSGIEPSKYAVRLGEAERLHQGMPTEGQVQAAVQRSGAPAGPAAEPRPQTPAPALRAQQRKA